MGGVRAEKAERGVLGEAPVEFHRIGVHQQFGGVEPQPLFGRPLAMRAVTVSGAGVFAGQVCLPNVARLPHGHAGFGIGYDVEQA